MTMLFWLFWSHHFWWLLFWLHHFWWLLFWLHHFWWLLFWSNHFWWLLFWSDHFWLLSFCWNSHHRHIAVGPTRQGKVSHGETFCQSLYPMIKKSMMILMMIPVMMIMMVTMILMTNMTNQWNHHNKAVSLNAMKSLDASLSRDLWSLVIWNLNHQRCYNYHQL